MMRKVIPDHQLSITKSVIARTKRVIEELSIMNEINSSANFVAICIQAIENKVEMTKRRSKPKAILKGLESIV